MSRAQAGRAVRGRQFVDRIELMGRFRYELGRSSQTCRLLNVHGLPGVGKSRLLKEWKREAEGRRRTAMLDFRLPGSHHVESALAQLRAEFGAQGVKFDKFDIAYAAFWQKIHPHQELRSSGALSGPNSDATARLLDSASGASLLGAVAASLRLFLQGLAALKRNRVVKADPDLGDLKDMLTADLLDTVMRMFVQDLAKASEAEPYVLFVDSYDVLSIAHGDSGGTFQDAWLRDLLEQLSRGLIVVAGREPLTWQGWADTMESCQVLPLESQYCDELLSNAGVDDTMRRSVITRASQGIPFYLELAADTPQRAAGEREVPQDRIKERFLDHVPEDRRRVLQHLGLARLFNRAMFMKFVKDDTLWDELVRYSFVQRVGGGDWYQLHQLMVDALQSQWSPERQRPAHEVLQQFWEEYAESFTSLRSADTLSGFVPLQEAIYHGLRAERISADAVLEYADRIRAVFGSQSVNGVVADIRRHLEAAGDDPELARVARCLAAEEHVLRGKGRDAMTELAGEAEDFGTYLGARTALASAHAKRLVGRSAAARDTFHLLWTGSYESVRSSSGFALADITMCAGDFPGAFALADELLVECGSGDGVRRAELKRLKHLAYRFLLDFDSSERYLSEAESDYRHSGSIHGLADIQTNRAELLAFKDDPAAAVAAADIALETQRALRMGHEVGKALTAKAIAQMRLGMLSEAEGSFEDAIDALKTVDYRSGLARAQLFRAFLDRRLGRHSRAVARLRSSAARLERAGVYPFLSVLAHQASQLMGTDDRRLAEIRQRATPLVRPLGSNEAFEGRLYGLARTLLS
ncbi:AAA family ATPase [Streptomyces sp. NPDC054802]